MGEFVDLSFAGQKRDTFRSARRFVRISIDPCSNRKPYPLVSGHFIPAYLYFLGRATLSVNPPSLLTANETAVIIIGASVYARFVAPILQHQLLITHYHGGLCRNVVSITLTEAAFFHRMERRLFFIYIYIYIYYRHLSFKISLKLMFGPPIRIFNVLSIPGSPASLRVSSTRSFLSEEKIVHRESRWSAMSRAGPFGAPDRACFPLAPAHYPLRASVRERACVGPRGRW